jgi:UDP-glucose 4-epimerase
VDALIQRKDKVIVIDNLSTGRKENLNKKAKFYEADIADSKAVFEVFKKEKPQIVIHHAAQIDVRKSVDDPAFDANVNIIGSINILKGAVDNKAKKVIFASSGGTIYGECGAKAPDESAAPNPISPYGIAKFCVENYIKFFSSVYGIKYTILRYGNVYGPRQDPLGEAGVVAIFSKRMLSNEPVIVFGNGRQMRDYVFVGDVVDANLRSISKGNNQIINIGTQKTVSVLELIKVMSKVTGYAKKPTIKPKRAGELFKNFLDYSKAKKVLGWEPKTPIASGIILTLDFFKSNEK